MDLYSAARVPGQPLYLSGVGCIWTDLLEERDARIGLMLQPECQMPDRR